MESSRKENPTLPFPHTPPLVVTRICRKHHFAPRITRKIRRRLGIINTHRAHSEKKKKIKRVALEAVTSRHTYTLHRTHRRRHTSIDMRKRTTTTSCYPILASAAASRAAPLGAQRLSTSVTTRSTMLPVCELH